MDQQPVIEERPRVTRPHHLYFKAVATLVGSFGMRHKRNIFATMRTTPDLKADVFLPHYGVSVGEFSVFYVLNGQPRKSTNGK